MGLELATLRSKVANNNPDSIFRLSQHPGIMAAWYDHPKSDLLGPVTI